ncbi:MAG: cytochrome P450, partial [Candidatus Dormibacteria bacterium]
RLASGPVENLSSAAESIADGLIDAFVNRGQGDLMEEYVVPFTTGVFGLVMGVPKSETPGFLAWSHEFLHRASQGRAGEMFASLNRYTAELLDAKGSEPGDDLTTAIVETEIDGRRLSRDEQERMCLTLLLAGLETTMLALSTALFHLAQAPDQWARLASEPDLVPAAVEELLRFDGPVQGHFRTVTRDIDMHGVRMCPGDKVALVWSAANRDERRFDRPDVLDFNRPRNVHLEFGTGPHRCVGAPLARMEMRVALRRLLAHIRSFRLDPGMDPRPYGPARGFVSLPVLWEVMS